MHERRSSQAIVIIHGMGEHRPMSTLRGFMAGVFGREKHVYSQPDPASDSFELRRFQVGRREGRPRTFVYEYYWTHLMRGNTWEHLKALVVRFLFRLPWRLPSSLRVFWGLIWLLVVALAGGAWYLTAEVGLALDDLTEFETLGQVWTALGALDGWQQVAATVASLLLVVMPFVMATLVRYVGDVARYCSPTPDNVAVRQEIRRGAVALLDRLQRNHDRVVVVAHSLGSVVALDAMRLLWARTYNKHAERTWVPQDALAEFERLARALDGDPADHEMEAFRAAQLALWHERVAVGSPWRITDFVSLGSPLCLATLILARDHTDWRRLQLDREIPTCPPVEDEDGGFSYTADGDGDVAEGAHAVRRLHSGALFACVRWTNIWFPARLGFFGDWFGGELRRLFGSGVWDRTASTGPGRLQPGMAHVRYFTPYPQLGHPPRDNSSLALLREALDLDSESWLHEARLAAQRAEAAEERRREEEAARDEDRDFASRP